MFRILLRKLGGASLKNFVLVLPLLLPQPLFAQGVNIGFANFAAGVDAPVRDASQPGEPFVHGPNWLAQLYAAEGIVSDPSLLTTNNIGNGGERGGPASFVPLSPGYSGGYFLGGWRTYPGSYVTLTLQVRTWLATTGSSWETATLRGESNLIGWAHGADQIPRNLIGLQPWSNYPVPEPSLGLLALGGLAAVVLRKRR